MPKRPSKSKKQPSQDPNVAAFDAVRKLTGQDEEPTEEPTEEQLRSEAARILGRLGGSKGGKARAANLSKKRRSEIARKAARARWKNGDKEGPKTA